jgi:hypothetical protein
MRGLRTLMGETADVDSTGFFRIEFEERASTSVSALPGPTPVYPTVREIEAALDLFPGARIPRHLMIRGERYRAECVGAEQRSGGRYAIVVKLER